MARSTVKKNISNRNNRSRSRFDQTEEKDILSTAILLLSVIAISVLLLIAVLGYGGAFGVAGRIVLFGVFGIFAYVFPIALASGTCYAVVGVDDPKRIPRIISAIVTYMLAALLMELFLHGDKPVGGIEAFQIGQMGHTGGGFIGGFFSGLFVRIFGVVGAYVLAFAGLAICLVLLTENVPFLGNDESKVKHHKTRRQNRTEKRRQTALDRRTSRAKRPKPRMEDNVISRQQPVETSIEMEPEQTPNIRSEERKKFVGIANTTILPGHSGASDEITEIKIDTGDMDDVSDEIQSDVQPKSADALSVKVEEVKVSETETEETATGADSVLDEIVPEESSKDRDLRSVFDPDRTLKPRTIDDQDINAEPEPLIKIEADEPEAALTKMEADKPHPADEAVKVETAVKEHTDAYDDMEINASQEQKEYVFPTTDLLSASQKSAGTDGAYIQKTEEKLAKTLEDFGVRVTILDVSCGPTVTRYELQPEKGVKVSKIVNLADDIKLNLAAEDIRIEAPIPGKAAIGIEVPNRKPEVVNFRDMMESEEFSKADSKISFAVGKDIGGRHVVSDIGKMPHVLIAGATGAGKSVCINTIIMSILYKARPDEVKFIMIDPKVVELSVYNGIPHLLIPVVTDPKKAAGALHWAVKEMMDRYERFAKTGVRDIKGYNSKIYNGQLVYEEGGRTIEVMAEKMPQIVVIVDELADLMMVASNEVEEAICRLAQLARAAGIHLVIATQRPSVNVITGLIKANMPSRIAFSVTSGVDSRTILDMVGAEKLLGKGDMLYYPQGLTKPKRVQGAFVSDEDVARVVDFIRKNNGHLITKSDIEEQMQSISETTVQTSESAPSRDDDRDVYYEEAARLLIDKEKGSIGMLQRYFKIGFNRAARIMDQLEEGGVVGPEEGTKPRKILMTLAQFEGEEEEEPVADE